jgi:glucose-6-phosphate-specific signal transduction histidine kinase
MEGSKWAHIGKGLVLGALYCAAYWVLWQASFTQWFLPAGLRVAALLFLPYRSWPYLFAGDATALLILRAPKADEYSVQWAYASPFLLMPSIAIVIAVIKKHAADTKQIVNWLPVIILAVAISGSINNLAVNYFLSGPPVTTSFMERFLRVSIGYFLGILILVLPCILWLQRREHHYYRRHLLRDTAICILIIVTLFVVISFPKENEQIAWQTMLMLMLVPAAGLTYLHGWRGAAISLIVVNLATAQALPYTGVPGTYDAAVFIVQVALSISASAFLILGAKISHLYDRARQLGISEKKAHEMTRSSLLVGESNLREQVLYMAQMQVCMDDQRKQLVETLKAQGKFTDAMLLNSEAVEHMQSFESRATAIYPLRIEELGLYGVIFPDSFTDFWAGDADVSYVSALGQPKMLSVDLQLATYRCICNIFALLSQGAPEHFRVKLRAWKRGNKRGMTFKITAPATQHWPRWIWSAA